MSLPPQISRYFQRALLINSKKSSEIRDFRGCLVQVTGFEPAASRSQSDSNLVLHGHELHLALFSPENLLSGALFSAVSTSSRGGCGQTCGRMETLPWNAADLPIPGSVWIVALFRRKVKSVADIFHAHFLRRSRQRNTACGRGRCLCSFLPKRQSLSAKRKMMKSQDYC